MLMHLVLPNYIQLQLLTPIFSPIYTYLQLFSIYIYVKSYLVYPLELKSCAKDNSKHIIMEITSPNMNKI